MNKGGHVGLGYDRQRGTLGLEAQTWLQSGQVGQGAAAIVETCLFAPSPTPILTEFTNKAIQIWASRHDVRLGFTTTGSPTQNAFVELFYGCMRDQHLNQKIFFDNQDARRTSDKRRGF